jgi:hypothetical protein
MTTPTATLLSTAAVGNREDLADYISMIDPEEVPFYSWCGRGEATSTKHEWQTISLRAPAKNAQAEGDVFVPTTAKTTTRLFNYCQISTEVGSVSRTQEVVDKAGRGSEMDYQMLLKGIELRRDVEAGTLLANQDFKSTDPRESAGIVTWAGASWVGTGGTVPTANGDTEYAAGTAWTLNTDVLNNQLMTMWVAGARPDTMMMSPGGKLVFDNLAAGSNLADNQVMLGRGGDVGVDFIVTVAVYKSAFGAVKIMLNQWLGAAEILIFDSRQQFKPKVCPLPSSNFVPGPVVLNHDGKSRAVVFEGTLEVPNPHAVGLLAGFDTNVPS